MRARYLGDFINAMPTLVSLPTSVVTCGLEITIQTTKLRCTAIRPIRVIPRSFISFTWNGIGTGDDNRLLLQSLFQIHSSNTFTHRKLLVY